MKPKQPSPAEVPTTISHYYENVPGLGNVAVSRHAIAKCEEHNISAEAFVSALLNPGKPDTPDGQDVVWRERNGVRLVVLLKPIPNRGAVLVKTIYRVQPQANAR